MTGRVVKLVAWLALLMVVFTYLRRKAAGPPGNIPRAINHRQAAEPPPAVIAGVPSHPETTRTGAPPDDLTTIKGIGPVYAARLAEAGITSFTHLAGADPADLASKLETGVGVDLESWIEQAKRLDGRG